MNPLIYIVFLTIIHLPGTLFAQEKFEKESRIKKTNVPLKARLFVDSLQPQHSIKWYKEEGLLGNSIEAKFKNDKTLYSVEFDTLGNIQDLEIEINWDDIPSSASDSIYAQLKMDCLKNKIVKVQRQYSGKQSIPLSFRNYHLKRESLVINYELIVRCKEQNNVALFEYLFDEKGQFISRSTIVFKNSSHLEY